MSEMLTKEQAEEVRLYVRVQLRAGYMPPDQVPEATVEYLTGTYPEVAVRRAAKRAVPLEVEALRSESAAWPAVTDYDRLVAAFAALEKSGIVAREDYTCCQSCGHAEIRGEISELVKKRRKIHGYVFFHVQDTESVVEGGGLYLCFGSVAGSDEASVAVAADAAKSLQAAGLTTDWDGTVNKRVGVRLNWQRRPPWLSA